MSSSTKIAVVILLIAIVLASGVVLFFFHIKEVSVEAAEMEEEAVRAKRQQGEFQSVQEILENNEEDIENLSSYLVPPDGVPSFLSQVESVSSLTGANIKTQSVNTLGNPKEEGEGERFTEILELTASISGSWNNVYHTISLIETMPYKLQVKVMDLSRSGSNDSGGGWNATLKLQVVKQV